MLTIRFAALQETLKRSPKKIVEKEKRSSLLVKMYSINMLCNST